MLMLLLAALLPLQAAPAEPIEDPAVCRVDPAAQRGRAWADFEFSTDAPGGPMWLAGRGCYRAAAAASRDYLARGPLLSVREQAVTQLHMARNLAFAGDEAAAAQAAASARRSDLPPDADIRLDWNTYVEGLYGFLTKDRELLERSLAKLMRSGRDADVYNGRNLAALSACFEASYGQAMRRRECRPAETGGHPGEGG